MRRHGQSTVVHGGGTHKLSIFPLVEYGYDDSYLNLLGFIDKLDKS